MTVSGTYQDHNFLMFSNELVQDVQQKGSRLGECVTLETVRGQQAHFDKLGAASSYKKTERGQLKTFQDESYERRLITFETVSSDKLMDKTDTLDMVNHRPGDLIQSMAYELGRQKDLIIKRAIEGTATVQANGTTSNIAIPANQKIAVNDHTFDPLSGTNDIGLTPFKLRNALKKLKETYAVDEMSEEVIVVGSANVLMQLTTFQEVISADFRSTRPVESPGLIGAGLQGYLNLNYIAYEEFDNIGSDEAVYVFPKSAIKLGVRKPMSVEMLKDPSRVGNPMTLSATQDMGAVRFFEEKVVQIACDPTTVVSA